MYQDNPVMTFTANGALLAYRRVKMSSGTTTTPPQVEYAGAGEQHIGVTLRHAADAEHVPVKTRQAPGSIEVMAAKAFSIGATLYPAANGKVSDTPSGSAIGEAKEAATSDGDVIEMIPYGVLSTTAANVSIADAGELITATTVEAALQEIMKGIKTAQHTLFPTLISGEDGTPLAKFADGESGVGWTQLSNKELAIRWNNCASPDDIALQFILPQDLDNSKDVALHLLGAIVKAGADEADSPVFTVEAYFSTPGVDPGADDNCGGESGEFLTTADAAFQEKTLTIAAVNVPAAPGVLTLVIHPKDGELGTDDFVLLPPWLEVGRKCLTS